MARHTPLTRQTADKAGEFQQLLRVLSADGELCQEDQNALLLKSTEVYLTAERTDLARRKADSMRDTGMVNPWLLRQERDLDRDTEALLAA